MWRAAMAVVFSTILGGAAPAAAAQIVIVKSAPPAEWGPILDSAKVGLAAHTVVEHDLQGDRSAGARVLSAVPADAILVAVGPLAAQVAREVAPGLPLVHCMVPDPAALGLAGAPRTASVAYSIPVRNQLAAFRAVFPRAVRLGVVHGPAAQKDVAEAEKAMLVVRMVMVARPVTSERDVPQALRALLRGKDAVDALWMPEDPLFVSADVRRQFLAEALAAGKPVLAYTAAVVEEGALVSSGPDLTHVGERVATLVNRLASEGDAAKLEVLSPRAWLAINSKVAAQLKLDLPPEVLGAAQKVF
jgi:ABC-type uncharacterized transport system substrate-binding protein